MTKLGARRTTSVRGFAWLVVPVAALILESCTSGPLAPSCHRGTGTLIDVTDSVAATVTQRYETTSATNSNLFITLSWDSPDVDLGLRATVVTCGVHVGCDVQTQVTARRNEPTRRHLQVDGSRGKRYRVDVVGDVSRGQTYTLRVTYDTGVCT